MAVLHPEHPLGARAAADPGPQSQLQFQVHCEDDDGVIELVPVEPSEQFQVQFHTQLFGTV